MYAYMRTTGWSGNQPERNFSGKLAKHNDNNRTLCDNTSANHLNMTPSRRHAVTPSRITPSPCPSHLRTPCAPSVGTKHTSSTAYHSPPVAVHTLILCLCPRHTTVLLPTSIILFVTIPIFAVIFAVLSLLRTFATPSPPACLNGSFLGLLRVLGFLGFLGFLGSLGLSGSSPGSSATGQGSARTLLMI